MNTVFKHTLEITVFVFAMMLLVEYINVYTKNGLRAMLNKNRYVQYLLAAALGAIPGCLGAFSVVTLYIHGAISIGALTAAMIATSGDETFVMLAMIPKTTLVLTAILFVVAVVVGILTDVIFSNTKHSFADNTGPVHIENKCLCFDKKAFIQQWKKISPARGILTALSVILFVFLLSDEIGPEKWNAVKITFLFVYVLVIFVTTTVPDHFLEEHLWRHVVLKHLPIIFIWTFAILGGLELLKGFSLFGEAGKYSGIILLVVASLTGLIPESGPHLIFVTLFAQGNIPLSVLLGNSIVQDGHGMIPLLAHSRKDFFIVKTINFMAGLAVGAVFMAFGY